MSLIGSAPASPRRDLPAPRLRSGGRHGRGARSRRDDQRRHHVARRPRRRGHRGLEEGRTLHLALSQPERVRSMVPLEILPLPRPLDRFGSAFPSSLADLYANAYTARRGVVLDPLAHPWSAADAAERCDRRGVARSPQPIGAWAREVVRRAPSADAILAALAKVGESALAAVPHSVAMRELYGSM